MQPCSKGRGDFTILCSHSVYSLRFPSRAPWHPISNTTRQAGLCCDRCTGNRGREGRGGRELTDAEYLNEARGTLEGYQALYKDSGRGESSICCVLIYSIFNARRYLR